MIKVNQLINDIKSNLSQTSSSTKDEEAVMRAMLNDTSYEVEIYDKKGKREKFCPAQVARDFTANIIHGAAKVSKEEAIKLANDYTFKKDDSMNMITLSKEFVNTFIQTGRKLPFGGRKEIDAAISLKENEVSIRSYPKKVGVNSDGSARYEKAEARVSAHQSLRVHASCPEWKK